jgi:hypothetical protein
MQTTEIDRAVKMAGLEMLAGLWPAGRQHEPSSLANNTADWREAFFSYFGQELTFFAGADTGVFKKAGEPGASSLHSAPNHG